MPEWLSKMKETITSVNKAHSLPSFTTYVVDSDSTDVGLVKTVNDCCGLLHENDNKGIRIMFKIGKAVSFFFAFKEKFDGGRPTWPEIGASKLFHWCDLIKNELITYCLCMLGRFPDSK